MRPKEKPTVIDNIFYKAVGPAESLFVEFTNSVWRRGIDYRIGRIGYLVIVSLHSQRHLHIFGIVSMFVKANLAKDFHPHDRERSWDDILSIEMSKDVSQENRPAILNFLHQLNNSASFVDFHGRCHCHHLWVAKACYDPLECLWVHKGVSIKTADQLALVSLQSIVDRSVFAAIFFAQKIDLFITRKPLQNIPSFVSRTIIYN